MNSPGKLPLLNQDEVWYKEGLRFKCTGCGGCCTGSPGYVWLTEKDISALSTHLGLSRDIFLKRYTRQIGSKYSLLEDPKNYDCVFLKEGKACKVYEARPKQCRTFPFWKDTLSTPDCWEEEKKRCEGIDHPDAPLIPLEEIKKHL